MSEGFYKISTLAKLTGFGVQAIRNWERRHGLLVPQRTDGGHRLYTEADLKTLRQVRQLLDQGRSIGEIADLVREAFPASESQVRARKGRSSIDLLVASKHSATNGALDGALARCVLDAVPHGIVLTDAAGKTEWVNQGITDLCGYSLAQLVGRTPGSVLQGPGTDRRAVRRMAEAIALRTPCSEELLNYDAKNREYLAAVDIAPLYIGDALRGFVGLIRDLTRTRSVRESPASHAP